MSGRRKSGPPVHEPAGRNSQDGPSWKGEADGSKWSGDVHFRCEAYVGRKSEWATWTPPREMIKRQPEAAKWARGMPGGLDNPLGARTLYLYQNGAYTLYTIYASSEPESIGSGITSGCVGLLSQDMIDLYSRTPVKTKVVVLPA